MLKSSRLQKVRTAKWNKSSHTAFLPLQLFWYCQSLFFFNKLLDILHPVATNQYSRKTNVHHTKTVAAKSYRQWDISDVQLVKTLTCIIPISFSYARCELQWLKRTPQLCIFDKVLVIQCINSYFCCFLLVLNIL